MVGTTVILTDEEAARLLLVHKYFLLLGLLEKAKVLDIRSGSIQINFDAAGKISGVDRHEHLKV